MCKSCILFNLDREKLLCRYYLCKLMGEMMNKFYCQTCWTQLVQLHANIQNDSFEDNSFN